MEKRKVKEKDERQEIYILTEKRQKIVADLRLLCLHIKMEYQKITNVLGTRFNNVTRFITKKWVEVHDQLGNDGYNPSSK